MAPTTLRPLLGPFAIKLFQAVKLTDGFMKFMVSLTLLDFLMQESRCYDLAGSVKNCAFGNHQV